MGNVIVSSNPIPMISISVEEYKDLLRAQTELAIIYQKSANGDAYNTGTFRAGAAERILQRQAGGRRC